jgi:hypothetical protein
MFLHFTREETNYNCGEQDDGSREKMRKSRCVPKKRDLRFQ